MTVEEQIRDFMDGNIEHIDVPDVQRAPVVARSTSIGPRPFIVGILGVAATAFVVVGLVAIGQSSVDDGDASSTPQTTPTSSPATATTGPESPTVARQLPSSVTEPESTIAVSTTAAQFDHVDSAALFDLYTRLSEARTISFKAIDREVQQCMSEKGFKDVPTPTFLRDGFQSSGDELSWRFPNNQQAATTGYFFSTSNLPTVGEPAEGTPEFAALYGRIVGTWDDPDAPAGFAVAGDIYDGCLPTAQVQIIGNGDVKAGFRINDYNYRLQRVLNPAIRYVTTAPEFLAAQAAWVQCMADAGFDVPSLDDPPARSWSQPRPSPAETAMATADAACKDSTGVRELGDRLFNQEVASWFDSHPDDRQEIIDFAGGVIERSTA